MVFVIMRVRAAATRRMAVVVQMFCLGQFAVLAAIALKQPARR